MRRLCEDVIVRENSGLDFGSWATALAKHGQDIEGDLLLANDSVYGPIGDLGHTLQSLTATRADFYGLVESLDPFPHLQSWFMLFGPAAHKSAAFAAMMAQPFESLSKAQIIAAGELGLSRALTQAGFKYHAAYMPSQLSHPAVLSRYNPAHTLWRPLLEKGVLPFVKVELLRDNPIGVQDLGEWRGVVESVDPDVLPLIEGQLRRKKGTGVETARELKRRGHFDAHAFIRRDVAFALKGKKIQRFVNGLLFKPASRIPTMRARLLLSIHWLLRTTGLLPFARHLRDKYRPKDL